MLKIFLSLLRESSFRSAFYMASRYVRPELVMAGLYLVIWIDPLVLGVKTFEGLSMGLWLEFVLAHAHTGTAVVGAVIPVSSRKGKIAVGVMSGFYLLFVAGISLALGSILTVLMFVILSIKRITAPDSTNLIKEIFYAFLKVMILLLAGGVGAGLAQIFPADVVAVDLSMSMKGAENAPAWGFVYFVALYYYEDRIVPKYFNTDLKTAEV